MSADPGPELPLIPHRKHRLFNRMFVAYARHKLRGSFDAVRVAGLDHARAALAEGPVVVVANHQCWWDAILLMWFANYAFAEWGPSDGYAMMDARNLRKMPFFRMLGVFGVDLDDEADRAAVIPYAASLLDAPGQQVWIFAQGAERPLTEPLDFKRGAAAIAHGAGARVLPAALRFELGRHEKPTAYAAFGPPLDPVDGGQADVQGQVEAVRALLDDLEEAVRAAARREDRIPVALPGRSSWLGALAERSLSWMIRTATGR